VAVRLMIAIGIQLPNISHQLAHISRGRMHWRLRGPGTSSSQPGGCCH
jgi:hypothetical protein